MDKFEIFILYFFFFPPFPLQPHIMRNSWYSVALAVLHRHRLPFPIIQPPRQLREGSVTVDDVTGIYVISLCSGEANGTVMT